MYFRDITGQDNAKRWLISEARSGKVPHARLLAAPQGAGGLPLAIAYARYLCCTRPGEEDACGQCPSCVKFDKLAHPDLHFVFPVVKRNGKDTVSDDWLPQWREALQRNPYISIGHWLQEMNADNQQALIYVKESDAIARKLSLKPSQGERKMMIVWLPEKMNADCANKLLKLLEEPSEGTVFLLVSEEPEKLLPTILSRTQRLNLKPVLPEDIAARLRSEYALDSTEAERIARCSAGSWLKALESIHLDGENGRMLELFISLMRLAYQRKLREMKQWSETLAAMGRENQKRFLQYAQRMIRENFVLNFHEPGLCYMDAEENAFASRFAPFVNERNIIALMDELAEAEHHIAQNVNARMVFFDFALKTIVLLVQK